MGDNTTINVSSKKFERNEAGVIAREECDNLLITLCSLLAILFGLVGIFFSGFVAMNMGTFWGLLMGLIGVAGIERFRKMKKKWAIIVTLFCVGLVGIGILFLMIVGLRDHNILSAYSGLIILVSSIVMGALYLWEER